MQKRYKCFLLFLLGTLLGAPASWAQSLPPRIFFSDLESGPNIGGQNGKGAFVTIYGRNFGATRGTSSATVGGGAVDNCPLWTDTKVACQLGPAAQTGNIVISVGGQASNGVPFTVRPGNIYFVSPAGSDTNPGTFAAPFKTPAKGKNALTPGDTLYLMDGINTSAIDDFSAVLNLRSSGAPGLPKAIVAYPGASVTLGSDATPQRAVYAPAVAGGPWAWWVIAGLTLRASDSALEMVGAQNWRVVGNDVSCRNGNGASACTHGDTALFIKFFGNNVHDAGVNNLASADQKLYHSVYFSTDSNHIEVGWNTIVPNGGGCRALQFHSSPNGAGSGFNQFDLSVHDNLIHDARCDGINFATVDPTQGKVEAYNNIVYRAGLGPDPGGQLSNYSCIAVLGGTNAGPLPGLSAAVQISNNTLYDCGARRSLDSGGMTTATNGAIAVAMKNNIFFLLPGETYFTTSSNAANVTGSNNLFFGAAAGPKFLTGNVNADPKFANTGTLNLRLLPGSPAIDAGINSGINTDFDGVARPKGAAFDIGAFEFPGTTTAQQPNPPANLRAVTVR